METKLYVGNLPYRVKEEDLKELFSQAGTVISVSLVKDRFSGQSKGFGFVEMSNQVEMEKAISMFNEFAMENRNLKVNMAKPREERPAGLNRAPSKGDGPGGRRERNPRAGGGGNSSRGGGNRGGGGSRY